MVRAHGILVHVLLQIPSGSCAGVNDFLAFVPLELVVVGACEAFFIARASRNNCVALELLLHIAFLAVRRFASCALCGVEAGHLDALDDFVIHAHGRGAIVGGSSIVRRMADGSIFVSQILDFCDLSPNHTNTGADDCLGFSVIVGPPWQSIVSLLASAVSTFNRSVIRRKEASGVFTVTSSLIWFPVFIHLKRTRCKKPGSARTGSATHCSAARSGLCYFILPVLFLHGNDTRRA